MSCSINRSDDEGDFSLGLSSSDVAYLTKQQPNREVVEDALAEGNENAVIGGTDPLGINFPSVFQEITPISSTQLNGLEATQKSSNFVQVTEPSSLDMPSVVLQEKYVVSNSVPNLTSSDDLTSVLNQMSQLKFVNGEQASTNNPLIQQIQLSGTSGQFVTADIPILTGENLVQVPLQVISGTDTEDGGHVYVLSMSVDDAPVNGDDKIKSKKDEINIENSSLSQPGTYSEVLAISPANETPLSAVVINSDLHTVIPEPQRASTPKHSADYICGLDDTIVAGHNYSKLKKVFTAQDSSKTITSDVEKGNDENNRKDTVTEDSVKDNNKEMQQTEDASKTLQKKDGVNDNLKEMQQTEDASKTLQKKDGVNDNLKEMQQTEDESKTLQRKYLGKMVDKNDAVEAKPTNDDSKYGKSTKYCKKWVSENYAPGTLAQNATFVEQDTCDSSLLNITSVSRNVPNAHFKKPEQIRKSFPPVKGKTKGKSDKKM